MLVFKLFLLFLLLLIFNGYSIENLDNFGVNKFLFSSDLDVQYFFDFISYLNFIINYLLLFNFYF